MPIFFFTSPSSPSSAFGSPTSSSALISLAASERRRNRVDRLWGPDPLPSSLSSESDDDEEEQDKEEERTYFLSAENSPLSPPSPYRFLPLSPLPQDVFPLLLLPSIADTFSSYNSSGVNAALIISASSVVSDSIKNPMPATTQHGRCLRILFFILRIRRGVVRASPFLPPYTPVSSFLPRSPFVPLLLSSLLDGKLSNGTTQNDYRCRKIGRGNGHRPEFLLPSPT